MLCTRRACLAGLLALMLPSGAARALEHVELRNGFSYDCVRREMLPGGQVRLFLSGNEPSSYVELPAAQISSVEVLPDALKSLSPASAESVRVADVPALLTQAGSVHNIDRELLASIVHAESAGHAVAVSHAGARGLMQLMPGTARQMGVADAFKPEDNINGGSAYLDLLLTRYRDNLALALAAYNAGPGAVDRFHGIPPFRETRLYVARVMIEFKRRKLAVEQAAVRASSLTQSITATR